VATSDHQQIVRARRIHVPLGLSYRLSKVCQTAHGQSANPKEDRMRSFIHSWLIAMLLAVAESAAAQNFPNRAVTLTVGFAPGGGADTSARIIAQKLAENIGQPVAV